MSANQPKRSSQPEPPTSANGLSDEWKQREAVWNADLPTREKLVLLAFIECDRKAHGRDLFPSMERIAWQTGYANSTVRQAVEILQQRRILERVGHVASRYVPRGRVSAYRFHAERLPSRPLWTADRSREPAAISGRQAPADADRSREPAAVNGRQAPADGTTGADSHADRRRFGPRQAPAAGGDRTDDRNVRTYE